MGAQGCGDTTTTEGLVFPGSAPPPESPGRFQDSRSPPPLPSIFLSANGGNSRAWRLLGIPVVERATPASASSSALTLVLRTPLPPQKVSPCTGKPPKGEGQLYSITSNLGSYDCNPASTTVGRTDRQADRLEASSPLALRLLFSDLNSLRFNPHRQVRIKFKTGFPRGPQWALPAAAGRPLPGSAAPARAAEAVLHLLSFSISP